MASVTPTTTTTATGYVDPHKGCYGGVVASTGVLSSDGVHFGDVTDMRVTRWYVASVDDGDTWDGSSTFPPPKTAVATAWQGDDVDTDKGCTTITAIGGIGANTSIRFDMQNAGSSGWVWVLSRA